MNRRTFLKASAAVAAAAVAPIPVLTRPAAGPAQPGLQDRVVADDTEYLQGIIDDAATAVAKYGVPAWAVFPSGSYQISRTLVAPRKVSIVFRGGVLSAKPGEITEGPLITGTL